MLNIYYGGENCDKEKFIFDSINLERKTILIVPDQFSLQMERDALDYYKEKTGQTALLNLIVADFSSLGHKVVKEAGGKEPELIDKYGRHMLLSILIQKLVDKGQLNIFENMSGRNSFTANTNQLISEMKRYGTMPTDLEEAAKKTGSFLKLKLADISKIFKEYENAIEGRFVDSEDYIKFYGGLMVNSELINNAEIWIYGFDTFTPLNLEVIQKLIEAAHAVNVVLTKDGEVSVVSDSSSSCDAKILTAGGGEGLFSIVDTVIDNLKELDEKLTIIPLRPTISCDDDTKSSNDSACCNQRDSIWKDNPNAKITLASTSNIYAEADRVAAYIIELVRDKGYRYGDITVICNDMDIRGGVLKRTFDRWNIPAFADRKRKVLHQPVVRFLLSLLDVVARGYDGDSIMKMINSGLMGWTRSDEELLINYISEGKIRGTKWKEEFTWTGAEGYRQKYSEEELARLNEIRQYIVEVIEGAKDEIGKRNSAGEKIKGLYEFLEAKFTIRERISELIEKQTQLDLMEGAAETAQSWNMICGLFSQILRIVGEDNISNIQLRDILCIGLEEMEIGLVPTSNDCVIIGTLQRTRISKTRALIVTSANEGILPLQTSQTGLLTNKELDALEGLKLNITKKEEVRCQEEQLAIYRMFSLPSDQLFVSFSLADQEGKSASPSGIFTVLKELCEDKIIGDLGKEDVFEKIISQNSTMTFMADAMQNYIENGYIDDVWLSTINWYLDNRADYLEKINQGLKFDNKMDELGNELADNLYFGDKDKIRVSASRLELYTSCPFRHFIQYGLKAEESRKYEIDGRSKGDVYHNALQILSERLMPEKGIAVCDIRSPWMTITEEECRKQVEEILLEQTANYREGVYTTNKENKLRLQRVIENCGDTAWAMIGQVRKSQTHRMYFEESFGQQGGRLAPIEIKLASGKTAVLNGKIDRIDVIGVNNPEGDKTPFEAIRIVDYKTGQDKVKPDYIKKGYKLQLMIYVNAACGSKTLTNDNTNILPAGVFYFKIGDYDEEAKNGIIPDKNDELLEERIAKACKLDGLIVNNENIIRAMDQTVDEGKYSSVMRLEKDKEGEFKSRREGVLISQDEFNELCLKTSEHVERICKEIQNGRVDIAPKKEKGEVGKYTKTSCSYCQYKSICLFDTSFKQCRYEEI